MGRMVPMLTNFNENFVNKSNAPLELQKLHSYDLLFFNDKSWNFVDSDKIDARCNEKTIIIYESIIFNHVIVFYIQNKVKQMVFQSKLR